MGDMTDVVFCVQLCDAVDKIDHLFLGWWLAERQVKAGGLNGRPEKLPDVCYSWWVLSSLCIMGKMHWIDQKALARCVYFILILVQVWAIRHIDVVFCVQVHTERAG